MEIRNPRIRMVFRSVRTAAAVVSCIALVSVRAADVLIVRPAGVHFEDAAKGFAAETEDELTHEVLIFDRSCTVKKLRQEIVRVKPKMLLLMDNSVVNLYRAYCTELPPDSTPPPSVSLMCVLMKVAVEGLPGAAGISYEAPLVTSVVSLRQILDKQLPNIGVVHRSFMDGLIEENRRYCEREKISIHNVSLGNGSKIKRRDLTKAFKSLIDDKKVDAIWVPNDNALLTPDLISECWVRMVRKQKIPIIVGLEVLAKPSLDFGTFAVAPDHVDLGAQAAKMALDIAENDWEPNEGLIFPPLSVYKVINLKQAQKFFGVSRDKLSNVDKILEK
jgi:hypothetical protein